ncbi:MAG: hypothetical protein QXP70_05055, partial [Methanomassiliicoccales archaeon]
ALSYVTIQRSSQGISTGLGKPAYLQISSSAQPLYMINGNTTSISFNITVYTAPTTLYLFDISPLNASSSTWLNITSFSNHSSYELLSVSNGTSFTVTLYLNSSVVSSMVPFNPKNPQSIYTIRIIAITSAGGSTGLGFGLGRLD